MTDTNTLSRNDRAEPSGPEQTRGGIYFTPRVDIYETDTELVLCADLPGVRPEDVDLRFEKGELLLHGRVPSCRPEGELLLQEYAEGDFFRVFAIHESIDSTGIAAECKNGVLTVHLPKVEAARPRQITVRSQ